LGQKWGEGGIRDQRTGNSLIAKQKKRRRTKQMISEIRNLNKRMKKKYITTVFPGVYSG
jgi:hypothetical protein